MKQGFYGKYGQTTEVPGYGLVNRVWYFYDDAHEADPTSVLKSIQQWIKKNPNLDISSINLRVGWDGEQEISYVEADVSFTDPAWPVGIFAD